jgi:hypothetical protein
MIWIPHDRQGIVSPGRGAHIGNLVDLICFQTNLLTEYRTTLLACEAGGRISRDCRQSDHEP